jgi:hypothetical protein
MKAIILTMFAAMVAAAPARAEVTTSSANGFEVKHQISLVVPQARAYASFGNISAWWSKDHTYSGDASKLTLRLTPGGCFCETIEGGGIEHLKVSYVKANEQVVFSGALGPLLYEGVAGSLDVKFEKIAGGTRVTFVYRAAGFARGNAAAYAPTVDAVLGEQVRRLRVYAAGGAPKR